MKTCTSCKLELPKTNFNKNNRAVDMLSHVCRDCQKQYRSINKEEIKSKKKETYEKNKEFILSKKAEYYTLNSEIIKQKRRDAYRKDPDAYNAYQKSRRPKKIIRILAETNTKKCLKCELEISKENFRKKSSSKDGLVPWCTTCFKLYEISKKDQYKTNRDAYREENKEKAYAQKINYRKLYPEKFTAWYAKRRAAKLQAIPNWANFEDIKLVYEHRKDLENLTGIAQHVDHIVPLTSDLVCGLHCEANLQILTAHDNISKGNRFWPDMW